MSERKYGPCWEAICAGCGGANACRWQEEQPAESEPMCGWCGCGCTWQLTVVPQFTVGRMSGFSTSESDFVPHFNRSLGQPVESLAHMRQLQREKGCEDAVVKGDGAERHAPRDVLEKAKRAQQLRKDISSGRRVDMGHGVSVGMVDE